MFFSSFLSVYYYQCKKWTYLQFTSKWCVHFLFFVFIPVCAVPRNEITSFNIFAKKTENSVHMSSMYLKKTKLCWNWWVYQKVIIFVYVNFALSSNAPEVWTLIHYYKCIYVRNARNISEWTWKSKQKMLWWTKKKKEKNDSKLVLSFHLITKSEFVRNLNETIYISAITYEFVCTLSQQKRKKCVWIPIKRSKNLEFFEC